MAVARHNGKWVWKKMSIHRFIGEYNHLNTTVNDNMEALSFHIDILFISLLFFICFIYFD